MSDIVKFRDLDNLQAALVVEAERQGLNGYSELIRRYIRDGLRGKAVDMAALTQLKETQLESIKAINKIGTNINQLMYLLHRHGIKPDDAPEICKQLSDVNQSLLDNVEASRELLSQINKI
ncbi:plasmid mobilization relaxosome protein MobC [Vibrio cholerae]|uniref:plasmid mobilization relaxosome protein MobC n=1 Tax=Vibrio TaxID=662 RepID=UPI00050C4B50|nr:MULTISPECIES: plasmid mobilization relaxosome protein MobC [Vibrio]EKF9089452.1 plasmid mobilization relaxosome protein MobC [Vibrio cholerae]EKF9157906.1 plasmid mobilization relaxosome protein MobC [Vibrio cholerae]ELH0871338.1 plasmid mobilization relaxosome protein MobC [Vibrio cholerae]NOF49577.1 MobC family plasmid mobilization relaxosome protein [Vibrio cholerae]